MAENWDKNGTKYPFFTVPFPPIFRRSKIFPLNSLCKKNCSPHHRRKNGYFCHSPPLTATAAGAGACTATEAALFSEALPGPSLGAEAAAVGGARAPDANAPSSAGTPAPPLGTSAACCGAPESAAPTCSACSGCWPQSLARPADGRCTSDVMNDKCGWTSAARLLRQDWSSDYHFTRALSPEPLSLPPLPPPPWAWHRVAYPLGAGPASGHSGGLSCMAHHQPAVPCTPPPPPLISKRHHQTCPSISC